MRVLSSLLISVVIGASHLGCSPKNAASPRSAASAETTPIEKVAVDDDGFAAAALAVLQNDAPSPRRLGLLVGVVQRQLGSRCFAISIPDRTIWGSPVCEGR